MCQAWLGHTSGKNRAGVDRHFSEEFRSYVEHRKQKRPKMSLSSPPQLPSWSAEPQGLSSSRFFFSRSCLARRAGAIQRIPSDAVLSSLDSRA